MNRTHFLKRPSNTMVRMFHFRAYFSTLTRIKATGKDVGGRGRGGGRGEEGPQQMFIRGGSAPRSNSLHFYKPFFMQKAPFCL